MNVAGLTEISPKHLSSFTLLAIANDNTFSKQFFDTIEYYSSQELLNITMDPDGDVLWGDDEESSVYAEAHNNDLSLVFRFSLNSKRPRSIPNRIVNCYYDCAVSDQGETFPAKTLMFEAVYSTIRQVWGQCASHSAISARDVVSEIFEDSTGNLQWRISHEGSYWQYVESLLPAEVFYQGLKVKPRKFMVIDYSSLITVRHLGGGGRVALVHLGPKWSNAFYVFKGVDFGDFLETRASFEHLRDMFYHEIRTICSIPEHPNVISSPDIFTTVSIPDDPKQTRICGALYPFITNGTLRNRIKDANDMGVRLEPKDKAKWCFQMTSAICHTFHVARNYHMDIKPGNFLLDSGNNVVLCSWEQSGGSRWTLAPEADGSWDVVTDGKEVFNDPNYQHLPIHLPTGPKITFKKYNGPDRQNMALGWPKWNVFPLWRESHPRALEAAMVYSLGRTMWMLLNQMTTNDVDDPLDDEPLDAVVFWYQESEDISGECKAMVERCLKNNPNKRPSLEMELVGFWEAAWHKLERDSRI